MRKRPVLDELELQRSLDALTGWTVNEEGLLAKKYTFPSFLEGVAFINRIAEIAERMNHHPFIGIDYRRVTLRLTTWSSGGLTSLDIESAAAYDAARSG
ncbi:4a-hydroxytetrahydrobiopterin dehydratase [Paenibacillus kobensis]|uniref:4a-hydroxytetrahydrobiopterin dehydratase n=1 Tax=Paenibacillus kobensis TaxID=59841 RepID=UPI000FD88896|nr:4a-hydroxytetrahydrobiopterin dehydratase [Paenibacillus kobensis]